MIKPDFLIKPYEVHSHPGLRPSDGDIYAVVYWFERLKDGKCTASNETIAEVACCAERTVRAGLERLERHGFIKRVFEIENSRKEGKEMMNRLEIKTLVSYTKRNEEKPPIYRAKAGKIKPDQVREPGAIIQIDADEASGPTPGEIARDFFKGAGAVSECRDKIIDEMTAASGAPRDAIVAEARKFYTYWTEPNKSGTKQRWELERTFDVKRRLYTWLSRAGKYNGSGAKQKAGAGTII